MDPIQCYCCRIEVQGDEVKCPRCGCPLQEDFETQKAYSIRYHTDHYDGKIGKSRINEARIVLFVLALFTITQSVVAYYKYELALILFINIPLAMVYALLGFLASKRPFGSILTGSILFLTVVLINIIFVPSTFFHGIIFKVVFFVLVIRALYSARKLEQFKKQYPGDSEPR